jgi:hypothetical protein
VLGKNYSEPVYGSHSGEAMKIEKHFSQMLILNTIPLEAESREDKK